LTRLNVEKVRLRVAVETGNVASTFNKKLIFGKSLGLQ
jgi:hypothetical protein